MYTTFSTTLVWVTKYRYGVLMGEVALRLREMIRQSCEARGLVIVRGNISKEHVHLLVASPPGYAPAKMVRNHTHLGTRFAFWATLNGG